MPNSISILEKKRVDKSYWRGSQLNILLGLYYIKSRGGKERFVMFGNPMINLLNTRPWRSIVTEDRWKLNLCASDQCELFDLNNDPYEETNLFNDPKHIDRIRIMTAKILQWQKSVDDSAVIPTI